MTVSSNTLAAFTDAAADRVARLIAETRREAARDAELRAAQFAAKMAEMDSRLASVSEIERRLAERLATLKDGEPGRDGTDGQSVSINEVLPSLAVALEEAVSNNVERVLATWDRPKDGQSVSVADVEPMLHELVAAIPAPKDGADGRDGVDGKDAVAPTVEEVASAIREDVIREAIAAALSEVRSWERPKDGKDYDPEELKKAVVESVAAIERPRDGVDGVGIEGIAISDDNLVVTLSNGEMRDLGRVVGYDGVDIDIDRVQEQIASTIATLWEECPKPKDGEKGDKGDPGAPGKLPIVQEWEDRVHYEGDVVSFRGAIFQAVRDTGKAPDHVDWQCIVRAGLDGADGRSFAIRGTWEEAGDYRALDVVTLIGGSFVAKRDDPGACPGEGWQLMASQGKRGKPGEKGPAGIGLRGLPGDSVTRMTVSDDGILTLTNGDGSTVECDIYPILSKLGG